MFYHIVQWDKNICCSEYTGIEVSVTGGSTVFISKSTSYKNGY